MMRNAYSGLAGLAGLAGGAGIASYFWGFGSGTKTESASVPIVVGKNGGNVPFDPASVKPQEYFKYGFPGPINDLLNRSEFISCYNRITRNPHWVLEHITAQSIKSQKNPNGGNLVDRKKSVFKEDEAIPQQFRGRLKDYFRSGYDRGHQAPAADAKFDQKAMDETFYLSNMSPQVGEGFNRDYWAHFEDFARRLTQTYSDVRIITGPLYLPKKDPVDGKFRVTYEVIGNPPSIAVPTHFFKVIVGEHAGSPNVAVAAFVLPNDKIDNSTPLQSFQVPVEALERSSGMEIMQKWPVEQKKDLCKEVKCDIIVREFPKQIAAPKERLALPPPRN
ncbi:hypothetical protein BABINDRAFT_131689 [Babjeviella inositovora NRRL Y-12698]|uniref:Endonuclease n=1 Tax=Babjeviella inositovora NRRL Y-12698 TaxID=984486 RepID=A0A1E3QTF8_9ASCO|nr:uncharacterized protein BABINDRAFT_131689 [Babjeviella inositovora NRRL Y-12698]ODQ80302.1 hypothetical protein BABINDRAFT_131689 [Babjeviella inositovora NRRL Y-12698]